MAATTKIEWADAVWNPIVGCSRVSAGCVSCYAERLAHRLGAMGLPQYAGLTKKVGDEIRWTGEVRFVEQALTAPMDWRKPRRVFVNSMSDLFHERVSDEEIDRIFSVMYLAERHQFMVLTKRPMRMASYIASRPRNPIEPQRAMIRSELPDDYPLTYIAPWPLPNAWLGVSVENRETLHRVDALRATPAAVRFVSFEPLLEDLGEIDLSGIAWAIWGGESGPGARPCSVEWIRRGVAQCRAAKVPAFVKQLGANVIDHAEGDLVVMWLPNRKGGDMAEWPPDLRVREFPR